MMFSIHVTGVLLSELFDLSVNSVNVDLLKEVVKIVSSLIIMISVVCILLPCIVCTNGSFGIIPAQGTLKGNTQRQF